MPFSWPVMTVERLLNCIFLKDAHKYICQIHKQVSVPTCPCSPPPSKHTHTHTVHTNTTTEQMELLTCPGGNLAQRLGACLHGPWSGRHS